MSMCILTLCLDQKVNGGHTPFGFGIDDYSGWTKFYCRQVLEASHRGLHLVSYEFLVSHRIAGARAVANLVGLEVDDDGILDALREVDSIRDNSGLIPSDLGGWMEDARRNALYRLTLTSRDHFTARGAIDKWRGHTKEPWFEGVVSVHGFAQMINLLERLRRTGC